MPLAYISNNCACTFAGVSRLSCTRIRGWPRDLNYPSHWYSVHQFSKIWTKIFPAKEFRKNEKRLPFPRWYEVTLWKSRAKDDTFYRYREEFVTVGGEVEKRKKGRQMDGGYRAFLVPSYPPFAMMHRWYAADEIGGRAGYQVTTVSSRDVLVRESVYRLYLRGWATV